MQNSGFKLFFFISCAFAVAAMSLWLAIFFFSKTATLFSPLPISWHAHEMIYGFGMAIAAGSLLASTTASKPPSLISSVWLLLGLPFLWVLARFFPFIPHSDAFKVMMFSDIAFMAALLLTAIFLYLQQNSREKTPWISISQFLAVLLLISTNLLYYQGVSTSNVATEDSGLFAGLYLLLALLLVTLQAMNKKGKRPGVFKIILPASFLLLLALAVTKVVDVPFVAVTTLSILLASLFALEMLLPLRTLKQADNKPLTLITMAAYGFLMAGFGLKASGGLNPDFLRFSTHILAIGGVGLISISIMLSSVKSQNSMLRSLALLAILVALIAAASITSIAPSWLPEKYLLLIAASQLLWIGGFMVFMLIYSPLFFSNPPQKKRRRVRSSHE